MASLPHTPQKISRDEAASKHTIDRDIKLASDGFPFVSFCDGVRSYYAATVQAAYGLDVDDEGVFRTTALGAALDPVASDGTENAWDMDPFEFCVPEQLPFEPDWNMRVVTADEDEEEDLLDAAFNLTNTQCADVD